MRTKLFCLVIAVCLPVLLEAKEPSRNIEDLLKPHVTLTDFAVTAPRGITHSIAANGRLRLSGELANRSGTIVLQPKEGIWNISKYSYFRVDITNRSDGIVWIRGRLDNEGALDWQKSSVDVTDTPYPEITAYSRALAEVMYPLADQDSVDFMKLLETTWRTQGR